MKGLLNRVGMAAAGLALMSAPVLAGQRERPTQDRGSTPVADRAVERSAPSGGGSNSGGSGSTASGGSSVESTSSAPSSSAAAPSFGAADRSAPRYSEPQRRGGGGGSSNSGGSQHRGGGSGGGDRAVPRGSGSSSGSTSKSGGDATTSSSSGGSNAAPSRTNGEVPSWSRPRGGRPVSGTATERTTPIGGQGGYGHNRYYYDPFYYPYYGYPYYGYPYRAGYYPGFGLGFGYGLGLGWPMFYDPWYDPWYSSYGYGGYGYGGGGGYTGGVQYGSADSGHVRLKVKPRHAKVYVDGYFVGEVDQFDGAFQKLALNGGRHKVEIKADGYETAEFDVLITPDETVTYQGELKKLQ